jgi:hypothetical protein
MGITAATETGSMIEVLHAPGPHPDLAEKLMLFGRLVGSWDIEGRTFDEQGIVLRRQDGEWHFGWILEGRAIQDVLIAPRRTGRQPEPAAEAFDTAVRWYDPSIDAWRITIVAPIFGVVVSLIAREHDDEIWLEGSGPQGYPVRWTFSDFTPERVRWQGFVSRDDGVTWIRDEEIILTRRPGATGKSSGTRSDVSAPVGPPR